MSEGGIGSGRTLKRKNVKGLALNAPAPRPPAPAESDAAGGLASELTKATAQLEIGIEYKLDLKREDLEVLKDLGHGNGGTVSKVRHMATGTIMARKIIHVEAKKEMRRRIVRELQIMYDCNSEYIVNFYGAFLSDTNDVIMCMEYMDAGSLDSISKKSGPVRVDVLGKIAEFTLGGLTYLYIKHHIMHRDIKPSNILVNSKGQIKLCDFGVSGELVNSVADTFVGTSTYMAPERIQGQKYTVKSDVWSFGLTIMELAIGKFPFDASEQLSDGDGAPAGILDLLQQIVYEPAPKLPKSDAFPPILEDMIQKCLYKTPEERPTPQELYEREPFVQAAKRTPVNLREWAVSLMERDNRKSHLAPQLSPATRDLLNRGDDSPTTASTSRPSSSPDTALETPTSGDIPISRSDIRTHVTSPNQHYSDTRNAINGSNSVGRAAGTTMIHPGMSSRGTSSSSMPRLTTMKSFDRESNSSGSGISSGHGGSMSSGLGGGIGGGMSSSSMGGAGTGGFHGTSLPMRPPPPPSSSSTSSLHNNNNTNSSSHANSISKNHHDTPPPPPPKKEPEDLKKDPRRQAAFVGAKYGSGYVGLGGGGGGGGGNIGY